MKYLFFALLFLHTVKAEIPKRLLKDSQIQINQVLEDISCSEGHKKRMIVGMGIDEISAGSMIKFDTEDIFPVVKNHQFVKSKKIYLAKSAQGDIFVLEKKGRKYAFYSYLCERKTMNLDNYLQAKIFIQDFDKSDTCSLRELSGVITINFKNSKQNIDEKKTIEVEMIPLERDIHNGVQLVVPRVCEVQAEPTRKHTFESIVRDYLILSEKEKLSL